MRDLRGTWKQALTSLLLPVVLLLGFRWLILEPFTIPSGSMIPTLLIHDYVVVKKWAFGLRVPFGSGYLLKWGEPQRGQVIVFQYPENPDVFYVKRMIARGGESVEVREGQVFINDQPLDESAYQTRYLDKEDSNFPKTIVPSDHYFMMGDNRDQSSDSRVWGTVPMNLVIGPAWAVWLSCDQTLESAQMICDPATMRWNRMFRSVH